MKTAKLSHGYSLIEAIVVIVLIGILAGFSFQAIIMATDTYITVCRDYLEIFQEAKTALEKMVREIRETDPASVAINGSSIAFTKKTGHVTPGDANLNITFSLDESNNIQRTSGGVPHVMTGNVTVFTPAIDANGVVTVELTVSKGKGSVHLRTSVYPRQPS